MSCRYLFIIIFFRLCYAVRGPPICEPLSNAAASVGFTSHRATGCCAQHSPLGCRRISHMLNPISFGAKLKDELTLSRWKFKSDLHSVRWNQRNPPSNFEMRPSRPRGLSVACRGLTALRDISRDLSPSDRVCLSVDCSTSLSPCLSFTLSLNIEDPSISANPHFFLVKNMFYMRSQSLMEQHDISLKTKKQKMCDLFCKAMTHHSDVGEFKTICIILKISGHF